MAIATQPAIDAPARLRTTDSDARWFVNYTNQPGIGRTTAVCHFHTRQAARHFARGKRGYIIRVTDGPEGGASFAEFVGGFEPSAQEVRRIEGLTGRPVPAVAPAASGASAPRMVEGRVGRQYAGGEIVTTVSGSRTTPFPRIDTTSARRCANTIARVEAWLIENAALEAQRRGDSFNQCQFVTVSLKNITQAEKDHAEHYLFDPDFLAPAVRRDLR